MPAGLERVPDANIAFIEQWIDDGCPEGSGDVAERHALRPRVVRQSNCGVARARNRGIAESRGSYVCALDADDCLAPSFLARAARILDADPSVTDLPRILRVRADKLRPMGMALDVKRRIVIPAAPKGT